MSRRPPRHCPRRPRAVRAQLPAPGAMAAALTTADRHRRRGLVDQRIAPAFDATRHTRLHTRSHVARNSMAAAVARTRTMRMQQSRTPRCSPALPNSRWQQRRASHCSAHHYRSTQAVCPPPSIGAWRQMRTWPTFWPATQARMTAHGQCSDPWIVVPERQVRSASSSMASTSGSCPLSTLVDTAHTTATANRPAAAAWCRRRGEARMNSGSNFPSSRCSCRTWDSHSRRRHRCRANPASASGHPSPSGAC